MYVSKTSLWKQGVIFTLCFFGMIAKAFAIHEDLNSFHKPHVLVSKSEVSPILPAEIRSPFKFINGLMFVTVQINGMEGLLLVDTGSNGFILLNADHFKTEKTNQQLKGMSAAVDIERTLISSFLWQNVKLEKQYLPAIKLSQLNSGSSEKVLGLIGSAFFKSYQLSLNFASCQLVLSKEAITDPVLKGIPALINMPFVMVNNFPIVEVRIADQPYRFVMDTGATDNVMDLQLEPKIGKIWQQTKEVQMIEGSGKAAAVRRGQLQELWIGGLNMQGIGMGLHAMPEFDQKMGVSGILGFQFLKYFYVQINYLGNTMKCYDMAAVLKK